MRVPAGSGSASVGAASEHDAWPSHVEGVELIWHRLNRRHDLVRFFRSSVRWAECDARIAPTGAIVVSHTPGTEGDLPLERWLEEVAAAGRSAKIDLKEGGPVLGGVISIVGGSAIADEDLWFNTAPEIIGRTPRLRGAAAGAPGRQEIGLDRHPDGLAPGEPPGSARGARRREVVGCEPALDQRAGPDVPGSGT